LHAVFVVRETTWLVSTTGFVSRKASSSSMESGVVVWKSAFVVAKAGVVVETATLSRRHSPSSFATTSLAVRQSRWLS